MKTRRRIVHLSHVVLIVALVVVPVVSAQAPSAPVKITTVEGITEYRLSNGLQVLLFPDASKPTVTVNITYNVGSRHEGAGETGMAHLLEHMLFKGTERRKEIMGELQAHGADFNGSTWYDRTNYFETLQASDENLRWALEMEADRMVHSRVSREDLDKEMTVVRNEFERGENNPSSILYQRVLSTAYLWHSYGRPTIGARSDIENVPIPRLQAFYRYYYQPDNATLVVAGKFDPQKTLTWIQEFFGAIPRPARQLIPTYTVEPPQDGERAVELRRVGDTKEVMMAYHIPAVTHPDSAAFDVLSFVLGNAPSGRLYKALVETKKATGVAAEEIELHDPGLFLLDAELLKEGSIDDVEAAMKKVVDEMLVNPPTAEEVDRAKNRILKNIELALTNSANVGLTLSESIASGDWRLLFLGRDQLEKVEPADVLRVARTYLKPSNRTIGRFIPDTAADRVEVPQGMPVAELLKDYTGKAAIEEGEVFDPSPANIESRVTRLTLPSGIKLVLLPKKTRGGTVIATLNLHFGDLESLRGRVTAGQMAGRLLMRGTTQHNREQLQDEFDKLKASVSVSGAATGAGASINTVRAGLVGSLRLVAEILRSPAFPGSEFEQIRQQSIAGLEASRSEPNTIAGIARSRHINRYPIDDPRAALTVDESIAELKKVTLEEIRKFYADFYGASNTELAVVGDFDPAEIQEVAEELFGSWKSPKAYTVIKREWQRLNVVNETFEAPDKANAYFTGITTMAMDQQDPEYPVLFLANLIFGGDPNSRVWKRIRETDGLSYGINTGFSAGAQEKFAQFSVGGIANPENIPKVEAAFKEELAKLLKEGFNADEVATAKSAYLQDAQVNRSQDGSLAALLARQAELGRTMQREIDVEKKIADATAEQLTTVLRKWIDPATISYFKAGDFKKAGVTR
jgi:zinc protease